jgi:exopolyphosphatase/guanosine-5'-triphosphate,3'-diphosphate pyrophosphatase
MCIRDSSALEPQPETSLIVDLGGGSTEFVLWHRGRTRLHRSYPLGVVRLAEDAPQPDDQLRQIASVLDSLRCTLVEEGWWPVAAGPDCRLVGTAGTVTTLAALHLRMADYDWRRINNLELQRDTLEDLLQRLVPLSVREREALPGMEPGRGDLILPGLRVILALLEGFGRKSLTVSDFGLLEGLLLDPKSPGRKPSNS